jgi:poly(3-hydroxybutyrate) depolymerase
MAVYIPKGAPKGGPKFAWALPGFDQESFDASEAGRNIKGMQEIYNRYPDNEMHPEVVKYWQNHGVRKELYDADIDDGAGKYSVFTPLDLEAGKKYALVYDSHGGMSPINRYETSGFPMLAGSEKLIVVCPWNRGPSNDEVHKEFPRIINEILKKGYPVDEERIYATGYSAGSDATGVLVCTWPEMIAAVSPNPGGNLFAKGRWYMDASSYEKNRPLQMPLICVGGTMDGGDRYPFSGETHFDNFNIWMETIVKVSEYEKMNLAKSRELVEHSSNPAKKAFGIDFQNTFVTHIEGIDWFGGEYYSEGKYPIARFIIGNGLPHAQTKYHARIIWDFLKRFRRDRKTGGSIYTPVVIDGIT